MSQEDLDLVRGTLDVLVLKTLTWGSRHGYGIAKWIRDTSRAELQVDDGALYTALHRLEERGWIKGEWGLTEQQRRAKFYALTTAGRRELKSRADTWTRYAEAVFRILGASHAESAP